MEPGSRAYVQTYIHESPAAKRPGRLSLLRDLALAYTPTYAHYARRPGSPRRVPAPRGEHPPPAHELDRVAPTTRGESSPRPDFVDGSLRDTILTSAALVVSTWQALGLALAALAFGAAPTAERFEAGLSGLRTFAKVGALALPLLLVTAGVTCEVRPLLHWASRQRLLRMRGRFLRRHTPSPACPR